MKGENNLNLKSKWMLSGVSSLLAISILLPTADANANTLNELEQQQQEAEQKKNELNSGIKQKDTEIKQTVSNLETILGKIQELNNKVKETEGKIKGVEAEIAQTKEEIEELRASIEVLIHKIEERTELLQERARAIQLSGGSVDYIDVLLGANSFVDFIDRFSAVSTLIDADREIMREQAADKELLAEQKASVETKLADQEARGAELKGLKADLDGQKKEQGVLAEELKAEQKRLESEKVVLGEEYADVIEISADLEKQIAAEQERLAELARKAEEERQAKLAAERAAAEKAAAERAAAEKAAAERAATERAAAKNEAEFQAANEREEAAKHDAAAQEQTTAPAPSVSEPSISAPSESNSAGFIRPAPGRLTSNYGGRDIGAGSESHLGVDIANSAGTPIKAAASGYVTYAGSMGTYGNVVMMTHSINGKTFSTVYAHMSSIGASQGQYVAQGGYIGAIGSTGRSTGPHLHFEVHIGPWNGARSNAVNPMNYIN